MNKLILTLMCVLSAFTVVWGADGDTFIQGDLKFTVVSESDRNVVVGAANEEISGDISIPSTVTNGNTQYAVTGVSFRGCTKITSVVIPNTVTKISGRSFYNCSDLTSLIIPSFVTSIGEGAFDYCPNLTDIYYGAEFPDEFISGEYPLFDSSTYSEATLWVPEKAVEQCRQIEPWKYFDNIKAYDFGNSGSSIDTRVRDKFDQMLL